MKWYVKLVASCLLGYWKDLMANYVEAKLDRISAYAYINELIDRDMGE